MPSIGTKPAPPPKPETLTGADDDWETDPTFINDLSEKESRWGSKTVEGSGHQDSIKLDMLRNEVLENDEKNKQKKLELMPKPSQGYGGKFGVETDRIDKCAAGFDYKGKVEPHPSQKDYSRGFGGTFGVEADPVDKFALGWDSREQLQQHESQKDYKKGFGGQFGVQSDRKDKSAAGWEDHEQLQKHESQKDYKKGFGGQFGLQQDRQDKSALGWEHREQTAKHVSQTDYKTGFGGKFGVQTDRKDASAAGWEEHGQLSKHESQTDYKKGFGGQFGVQTDRKDKSAAGWEEHEKVPKHESQTDYKKGFGAISNDKINTQNDETKQTVPRLGNLRSKFENLALQNKNQSADKVREEREKRKREDEELRKKQAEDEQKRQEKLEKQWADTEGKEQVIEESPKQTVQQHNKMHTSIGVRLPYGHVDTTTPLKDEPTEQPPTEQPLPEHQPVQVLPTAIHGASATAHALLSESHKRKSTNMDNEKEKEHQNVVQENLPEVDTTPVEHSPPVNHQYELPPNLEENEPIQETNNTPQQYLEQNPPTDPTPTRGLTAKAIYEYDKQDDDEIGFDINDLITDIEQIDVGWWRGWCKGQHGLFPANYVELVNR
uniref:SH3 domain-containing protein n=1 Tax=Meloidogyne enterolobii TaxID=390850 RepID=A0A6V7V115_MELEN|nr:unnamed protein product [Meloidogyne enterolobii]